MTFEDRLKFIANVVQVSSEDMIEVYKWALVHGPEFREVKSFVTHGQSMSLSLLEDKQRIANIIHKYDSNRLGQQTLLKLNNSCRLSKDTINKLNRELKYPPAFDKLIDAPHSEAEEDQLIMMSKVPGSNAENVMDMMKDLFRKGMSALKEEVIILTNGSATGIQNNGINITDVLGIAFVDREFLTHVPRILEYFKIRNYDPELEYIEVDSKGIGFTHRMIPDKEAKTREIYQGRPWVQVVSKGVSRVFEWIARRMPGNYTYNQMDYLNSLVERGFPIADILIMSLDMTKYSDCLSRRFILKFCRQLGIPEDVLKELDYLWSMDVDDPTTARRWSGSDSVYQGQYSIFAVMTLVNLYILACVYDQVGEKQYYKWDNDNKKWISNHGVVGDDTSAVFQEHKDPIEVRNIFQNTYRKVGVNLNMTKTHHMLNGEGYIDFVKRNMDCLGVLPYVIPSQLIEHPRTDRSVRELYRVYMEGMPVEKVKILAKAADWTEDEISQLMTLSVINGGISDHEITLEDILLFKTRYTRLIGIGDLKRSDTSRWLHEFKDFLEEQGLTLMNTAFIGYIPEAVAILDEKIDEDELPLLRKSAEQIDQYLLGLIENSNVIGYSEDHYFDLQSWVGKRPSEIEEWLTFNDYLQSFRFKELEKRKDTDIYQELLTIKPRTQNTLLILNKGTDESCLSTRKSDIMKYNRGIIHQQLEEYGIFSTEIYFGNEYTYFYDKNSRKTYRFYNTYTGRSKYDLIPTEVLKGYGFSSEEIMEIYRNLDFYK